MIQKISGEYKDFRIQRTLAALEQNGFKTLFTLTKDEALDKALELIPPHASVGVGGSVTIRDMGLLDALARQGNMLYDHCEKKLCNEDRLLVAKQGLTSDIFISSSNAITEDGKLVNVDSMGNRVASLIFGPKKVIVVAGMNKIVKDVDEGMQRIGKVGDLMNAHQIACEPVGEGKNNKSSNELCRVITIMQKKPSKTDITIILVGEEMGL